MKIIKWGAVLIGVYLVVTHVSNAGTLVTDTTNGGATIVKSLQGR